MSITRRHACECCGRVFICYRCCRWVRNAYRHMKRGYTSPSTLISPKCRQQFICEECNEEKLPTIRESDPKMFTVR